MCRLVCYIFFCCVMLYEELKRELSFVHKVLDKRYEREYYGKRTIVGVAF